MWAMIEKLRMFRAGSLTRLMLEALRSPGGPQPAEEEAAAAPRSPGGAQPAEEEAADLVRLLQPHDDHAAGVDEDRRADGQPDADDLGDQRPPQRGIEEPPHQIAHKRHRGAG